MRRTILRPTLLLLIVAFNLSACKPQSESAELRASESSLPPASTPTLAPTEAPQRLLTICMGQEPTSLFIYADGSQAARNVRQAIYDGPTDVVEYQYAPVILEEIPSLENGGVIIEPVSVEVGKLILDSSAELVNLEEGVIFRPSGCLDEYCAQAYSGQEAVQMDQLVVRFELRPEISWSNTEPLTADDSLFSFELAKKHYPDFRSELIAHTQSYVAIGEKSIEWRGVPGYQDAGYTAFFFTPLPRHAWGEMTPEEILTAEIPNRKPIGWGPYVIDEWTPGDHITLSRNPNYFLEGDNLPAFDKLVFRFITQTGEAIAALLAGECDYLDETIGLENQFAETLNLQDSGKANVIIQPDTAWEHADFGIVPSGSLSWVPLFSSKETRQALAMCLDRQRLVDEILQGHFQEAESYIPSEHPLFNPDAKRYLYDPQTAAVHALGPDRCFFASAGERHEFGEVNRTDRQQIRLH